MIASVLHCGCAALPADAFNHETFTQACLQQAVLVLGARIRGRHRFAGYIIRTADPYLSVLAGRQFPCKRRGASALRTRSRRRRKKRKSSARPGPKGSLRRCRNQAGADSGKRLAEIPTRALQCVPGANLPGSNGHRAVWCIAACFCRWQCSLQITTNSNTHSDPNRTLHGGLSELDLAGLTKVLMNGERVCLGALQRTCRRASASADSGSFVEIGRPAGRDHVQAEVIYPGGTRVRFLAPVSASYLAHLVRS